MLSLTKLWWRLLVSSLMLISASVSVASQERSGLYHGTSEMERTGVLANFLRSLIDGRERAPFRTERNIGLAPEGMGQLFMDYTPYLFPPEMRAPEGFLDLGRERLEGGNVTMRGVTPRRLERLFGRAGIDTQDNSGLGLALNRGDGTFRVFYNRFLDPWFTEMVTDHELAHVGGWNPTHDNH